jgi:hypothetical protein
MAMACWTLTAFSAHTITVAASRTRPAAAQQNARGARVKRILPGCRRIDSPPMGAHLLVLPGQALLAATSGNLWRSQVRLAAPSAFPCSLLIFTTLRVETSISRISACALQVSPDGSPCNFTLKEMQ